MEHCTFCLVIASDDQRVTVFEDKDFVAFLDIHPLFPGHSLLLPKLHIPTLYELPDNLTGPFFILAKKMGLAIQKGMKSQGSFVAINNTVSQSVPHLHMHIVPRNKGDGLKGFFWPRTKYENTEHMKRVQSEIKKFL